MHKRLSAVFSRCIEFNRLAIDFVIDKQKKKKICAGRKVNQVDCGSLFVIFFSLKRVCKLCLNEIIIILI